MREEAERIKRQKEIMKSDLDKQLAEKGDINKMQTDEEHSYNSLHKTYLNSLEEKEKKKQLELHNKMLEEKRVRDQQLKEECKRKKNI